MNHYAICIFENDDDFKIIHTNEAFYAILGFDEKEIQYKYGNHLSALLSSETIHKFQEAIEQRTPGTSTIIEHSIRNNLNKEVWFHSELDLSHMDETPSLIHMISYDVTAFLETEHVLSYTQQQLISLCGLSKHAFIDYFAEDHRIHIAYTDQFFSEDFAEGDLFPDALINKQCIHPDYVEKFCSACLEIESQNTGILRELKIRGVSNEFKWSSLSLIKNTSDNQEHIFAIFSDISSEKESATKYLNETLFYQALLNAQAAHAQIDITEDQVLRVGGIWQLYAEIIDKITYSELIERMIRKVVHADDQKHYLDLALPPSLINAQKNGINSLSCRFRRILEQNEMCWMTFTANIFEHPVSHHLMAVLSLTNAAEGAAPLSTPLDKPAAESNYNLDTDVFDNEFNTFLGESGEIGYLIDPRNYELLCGNQAFYKRVGRTKEECKGCKCYEIIHKRSIPCTFCANANWSTDHFYMYRNYNEYLEQEFLIKNKLIYWHGTKVLFAMAIDLSNNKTILDLIDNGITEDRVIISGIQNMQDAANLKDAVFSALESIGKFYGAKGVKFWHIDSSNRYVPEIFYRSKEHGGMSLPADTHGDCTVIGNWLNIRKWNDILAISHPQEMLNHSYDMYHRMEQQHINNELWFLLKDEQMQELGIIEIIDISINYQNYNFINSFARFVSTEWCKREIMEEILYSIHHDTMTDLFNRAYFEQYVNDFSEDTVQSVGMIICNIDGLKKINHSLGYQRGNEYICKLAQILKTEFKDFKIYRLNSDEFLTIFTDISHKEMEQNLLVLEEQLADLKQFTVSTGYSYDDIEKDLESLLEFASQSMQLNKIRYYNSSKTENKERIEMLSWITDAVHNGNMLMFLQPKVDVRTNIAIGAEALVRLLDIEGKLIPPNKFIPALESHNLIRYVDFFIFEETCRLLEKWKKNDTRMIRISLNFSRLTLTENDLISSLEAIITQYDVDKKYIEIEITESFDGIGKEQLNQCVKKLHTAGYSISLDDFGTKYTNLSILSYLDAEVLKIDRSLVHSVETDNKSRVILKNIILMCRELGMEMVAEGVETEHQAKIMKALGCFIIQGFLYSRPIPVERFEQLFLP